MILDSQAPLEFWGEAINTAVYLHQRLPNEGLTKRDDLDGYKAPYESPYEMLHLYGKPEYDKPPDDSTRISYRAPLHHLRRFRCYVSHISNYSSFRQKHTGVPDGSDGSDGTSYPLTENYTLPVAQATGRIAYLLLYFVVTFTHHQKDMCITLFAGAAVMLKPFTQRLAMLNHSYYLSFNDFQNLCIQFVFSSMYLCIYIATYLHTVYLDWQHAVIVSNSRCA